MRKKKIEAKINEYKQMKQELVENSKKQSNVEEPKTIDEKKMLYLKIKNALLCNLLTINRKMHRQKLSIISDQSNKTNKPVIYAVTHIGKYDFEMVTEALRKPFYVLSGDWKLMYGTIDDLFFRANGVIYVDTEDKSDRRNTYEASVLCLKDGNSLMWFPEGIWNLSDHLPMLGLYSGVTRAAIEANVEIIPIAIDQNENEFNINIGKNIKPEELLENGTEKLRDIMATLKWEIWEQYDLLSRRSIPSNYYDIFLEKRINEWPQFNLDIIRKREYKDKYITTREEAFAFEENLIPNPNNMFLFTKQEEYIKQLKRKGECHEKVK